MTFAPFHDLKSMMFHVFSALIHFLPFQLFCFTGSKPKTVGELIDFNILERSKYECKIHVIFYFEKSHALSPPHFVSSRNVVIQNLCIVSGEPSKYIVLISKLSVFNSFRILLYLIEYHVQTSLPKRLNSYRKVGNII